MEREEPGESALVRVTKTGRMVMLDSVQAHLGVESRGALSPTLVTERNAQLC